MGAVAGRGSGEPGAGLGGAAPGKAPEGLGGAALGNAPEGLTVAGDCTAEAVGDGVGVVVGDGDCSGDATAVRFAVGD